MSIIAALCIALTLLFRARAAVLAIVLHAVGRGAPRLAIAGLVVLAAGVQAQRDAALDRSQAMTIAGTPSTITAAPPFLEATWWSHFVWTSKFHAQGDVALRSPPPSAAARTRSHEAPVTVRNAASLLLSMGRTPQFRHGRRPVDGGAGRSGSRGTAALEQRATASA